MNLLVTGAWSGAKENIEKLESLGHQVCFLQFENDELPCSYDWVEGAICNGLFLSHSIEKFVNLKYIQLTSAGFDRVPMDYVKEYGIKINNAGGVYGIPMAEFALSGVLQLYKHSRFFTENQREHKWEKNRSVLELSGKTVCIVGCGNVGTECAKRFAAMGCSVIGVDLFSVADENYIKILPLDKLNSALADSDIVVLTLPLTEQTRRMFDAERFFYMKDKSIIVNIARGAVIDARALKTALKEKLYGAVLDVFEEEPLSEASRLWDMDNVILTPHNSFVGENNSVRLFDVIYNNLKEWGEANV